MEKWGYKLIVLDNGIGDHFAFLNILPELIKKYKKIIISCCYPEVFEDFPEVNLISIAAVPLILQERYNIYKWMGDNNWKESIVNAFAKLYNIPPIILEKKHKLNISNKKVVISPYSKRLRNRKPNPKNYPYWKEYITRLKERGYDIIQIGVDGEKQLVKDFRRNLKLKEIKTLLEECAFWISVDNFLPHFAHVYNLCSGIVLWGKSDPEIFGYPENINKLKNRENLRRKQFDIWEAEEIDYSIWLTPQELII